MAYRITIAETADTFEVESGEHLLDGADRAGLSLAHDCRFGGCGTCRIKLLDGKVDYDELPFGLSEEEAAQGYALACQARAVSDLTISATLRPEGFIPADYHVAHIESLQSLCHDVTHLVLHIPTASQVDYHPGQYLNVMMPDGSPRSFSMASPPQGGRFDLHVRHVPGGFFSERLRSHYSPGDSLDVELPLGDFRYRPEEGRKLLMVAGGTGLAPIKSIVESLRDMEVMPEIALYWGVRKERDLYFDAQLCEWEKSVKNFTYVPVLSDADTDWKGRRGYVHQAVCEDHPDVADFDAYLCGPPPMISAARREFMMMGLDVERIFSDSFNFTHELSNTAPEPA